MTAKAHTQNKMADGADEIFVWGDNFETILDIVEEDEEIDEQFTSSRNAVIDFIEIVNKLETLQEFERGSRRNVLLKF